MIIKKHLLFFLKKLTKFEVCVLLTNLVVGITLSVLNFFFGKNSELPFLPYLAFVALIFAIFSCIFAAKKMILAFPCGIIGSVFIFPIILFNGMFGQMIMTCFNCIMQIVLWIVWYKTSDNKIDIKPKKANVWVCVIYLIGLFVCISILTYIETTSEWFQNFWQKGIMKSKDTQSIIDKQEIKITKIFFDASILIFTFGVCYPLIKKYNQVWWMYLLIDCFTLIVWTINVCQNVKDFNAWFMIAKALSMASLSLVSMHNWKTT